MGKGPFRNKSWRAARRMVALAAIVALFLAPLVVIATHGPAAHAHDASITVEAVQEIAVFSHAHEPVDHDHPDGFLGGHNPADHDHQFHALVGYMASTPRPLPEKARWAFSGAFRNLALDGPRRPPRPA